MTSETKRFTVCALLYGDYPELAHRLLSSLVPLMNYVDFRLGLNDVSAQTVGIVNSFTRDVDELLGRRRSVAVLADATTTHKYHRMRQMFYGPQPVVTSYVLWLDDDSWLDFGSLQPKECLARWRQGMERCVLLGSSYTQDVLGNQRQWIEDQPWYTGKPIPDKLSFCTGGGWIADFAFLRGLDYPWPALDHNGGDVMLGQAVYQQGKSMGSIHRLLSQRVFRINADAAGAESRAPRRGFTSRPIGYSYTRAGGAVADVIQPLPAVAKLPRKRFLMDLDF